MMSKKQWCVLLCLLIVYLLLGAWFYDEIETKDEGEQRALALEELKVIEELIHKHYVPGIEDTEEDILDKLADYCGKPMRSNTTDIENPAKWDFYHSLFFVITVVTTIGYGNLAPTTPFGRIAMIFYALIGIPISGICMVTLGDFFAKSFTKIYRTWKTQRMSKDPYRLSLVAQVILYLIPGFIFFIFIPAIVIMAFEGWTYNIAVYYAFVTITTIGFGDYVAGVNMEGTFTWPHTVYRLSLLVWMISGLGYSIMIIGFITKALRSSKMQDLRHTWAKRLKKTPHKIREELRHLIREALLIDMKKAYKAHFDYEPKKLERSQSCPDLEVYTNSELSAMMRKRTQSACVAAIALASYDLESEQEKSDLVLRVAAALTDFTDTKTEGYERPETLQRRASSVSKVYNTPWYKSSSQLQLNRISEEEKNQMTVTHTSGGFLGKLGSLIFRTKNKHKSESPDVEHEDYGSKFNRRFSDADQINFEQAATRRKSGPILHDKILEETSVADLIRVLNPEAFPPTSYQNVPKRGSVAGLPIQSRRGSMVPITPNSRRQSLRPNSLLHHSGLPPYAPLKEESPTEAIDNPDLLHPIQNVDARKEMDDLKEILTEKLVYLKTQKPTFTKIYQRWKTKKMENDTTRLSLIAQIALYLIPGFTFFIFIPSVVIMMFEDWPYDVAVYYAFVTLTTIGFGDYVAGVNRPGTDTLIFTIYKLFLLVWIISGLGYVVMVMGFISRGMRSKKMHDIEHALAMNIKKTPQKIRNELRSLLREFVLQKIKSTYRNEFVYTPVKRDRSQSCPDLTIYRNMNSPTMARKRALSECAYCTGLSKFESVSETNLAENESLTHRRLSGQSNLLLQVANALGGLDSSDSNSESEEEGGGIHGFSDEEILASEKFGSGWNLQNQTLSAIPPRIMRQRACSEIKFPFHEANNQKSDLTWYGPSATLKLQEIREKAKHGKSRSRTLPIQPMNFQTPNLYTRLKNTFISPKQEEKSNNIDVEGQTHNKPRSRLNSLAADGNRRRRTTSETTSQYLKQTKGGRRSILPIDDRLLEQTSLADFIRALTAISVPEAESLIPQRKLGTASLTPPKQSPPKTRRFAIRPVQSRRTSLMPSTPTGLIPRRLSLRPSPVAENPAFLPPPPYTPLAQENTRRSIRVPGSNRRFSLRPVTIFPNPSPVQRQVKKTKEKDELKEILNEKL